MVSLLFPFPVAVVETSHYPSFKRCSFQEAALEEFHQGAFPTTWLSFDEEEVREIRGRPGFVFLMIPEPLQGAFVLFRNLFITCIVKTKAIQTFYNS